MTKEQLYKLYVEENLSLKCVAELLGCVPLTVRRMLVKHNIPIKWKNGLFQKPYTVNANFFKHWTADMAYLLGYITADGCMRPHRNELKINSVDYELLEHTQQLLQTDNLIRKLKNSHYYELSITSKELMSDLMKLGIHPRKTYTMALPTIPDEFFWDFLRGEIDGDGSIAPPKPNSIQVSVSLVGNEKLIKGILSILSNKINCPPYALNYNSVDKRICTLPIYSKYAYQILKHVYQNEKYGLSRKKYLALKVIDQYESLQLTTCEQCGKQTPNGANKTKFCPECYKVRQCYKVRNAGKNAKANN